MSSNPPAGQESSEHAAAASLTEAADRTNDFLSDIIKLNAKLGYDNAALKSQILFYDDLQDRRLKRQNDQVLFMQGVRQADSKYLDEALQHQQSTAHRDIAIASEWDVAADDIIKAGAAANSINKMDSEVSPALPGPGTSPGVAGSGVNAQSPTSGS